MIANRLTTLGSDMDQKSQREDKAEVVPAIGTNNND